VIAVGKRTFSPYSIARAARTRQFLGTRIADPARPTGAKVQHRATNAFLGSMCHTLAIKVQRVRAGLTDVKENKIAVIHHPARVARRNASLADSLRLGRAHRQSG